MMRKLYALLAGFSMALAGNNISAQTAAPDTANFIFTVDAPNSNVAFTNTSVIGSAPGIRRAFWSFGDGSGEWTPPLNNTQHHYQSAGTWQVCLKIYRYIPNSNDSVLSAHVCKTVVIQTVCNANFVFRDSILAGNPVNHLVLFQAISTHTANKPVTQVCWDFGDGTDTCINASPNLPPLDLLTIQHTYLQRGPYTVCVRIKYLDQCVAEKCKVIELQNIPADSCRANFERLPSNASASFLQATFKALPWHNNNKKPARICWTFGDGKDTCIQYSNTYPGPYTVNHIYADTGLYIVCAKILYQGGCEATMCNHVWIGPEDSCRADFERIPPTAATPLTVGFKALPWHNNGRKPVRICWTFGDGRDTCLNYTPDYTGQYGVLHHYNQPGRYNVCVKILYYWGCEVTKCREIVVGSPPPGCSARLFEITPSVTSLVRGFLAVPHADPVKRPERVCWNFGDGRDTCILVDPLQPVPTLFVHHVYPAPGVYRACVKIWFQGGCIAEDCREIMIRPATTVCGGYMTDSLTAPRTFKFRGFSIHNPGDEVLSYRWTFGDGTSAMGPEAIHTYNQGGDHQVCLTIKTRLGCETRICKTLRVPGNNTPVLSLAPNPVVNVLHAGFLSTHTEQVNIRIINGFGVQVRTYVRSAITGMNTWSFDLASLTPGIYTFIVQSPNQLASAFFIKL